uniref:DUF4116 domain-containing protein n=1 Tax=Macrostomum lignano TaxID=282301 RepID=A0A1I8FKA4_9PLAT
EHRTDELCQQLRLLNNLRFNDSAAWASASSSTRLLNRRLHEFAFRACELLRLSESDGQARVMMHWAECQIDTLPPLVGAGVDIGESREDARRAMRWWRTLSTAGVNYARLAGKAARLNRPGLARRLLDFETRSQDQVEQLLALAVTAKRWRRRSSAAEAAQHAVRAGLGRHHAQNSRLPWRCTSRPTCASDPAALLDQEDRRSDLAALELRRAFDSTERRPRRQELLGSAASRFTEAGLPALAKECQLAAQLLERQRKLERDLSAQQFAGLSLHAHSGQVTRPGQVRPLHRASPPIGAQNRPSRYAPFVNACQDPGNEAESGRSLLPRVERSSAFAACAACAATPRPSDFASGLKTDGRLSPGVPAPAPGQGGSQAARTAGCRERPPSGCALCTQTMAAGGGGRLSCEIFCTFVW